VFGDATAATFEKGEAIVDHVLRTAVDLISGWKEGMR